MPASRFLKTLEAVASTDRIMLRLTSLIPKRPNWWAALSSQGVIPRESQSNHREKDCTSLWEMLWEVTATLQSSISKNAPWLPSGPSPEGRYLIPLAWTRPIIACLLVVD